MEYANHAEIEALDYALQQGKDTINAKIYVAGYFPQAEDRLEKLLMIRDHPVFTCWKCPKHLEQYGVAAINVPTIKGWKEIPIDDAKVHAESYRHNTLEKRLQTVTVEITMDTIKDHIPYDWLSQLKKL